MFSSLPNLADRPFIVGFLVPTLALLLCIALLFADQPFGQAILAAAAGGEGIESLLAAVVLVWFVAIGLMMLNRPLLQVLEGYHGPLAWLGRADAKRADFNRRDAEIQALRAEHRQLGDAFPDEKRELHDTLTARFVLDFPGEERLVLPTSFGNTLRAFEDYPRIMHGADSIPLWPHIVAVADTEFLAVVEDARAQVNCLVNLLMVGLLVMVLAIGRLVLGDGSFVTLAQDGQAFVLVRSADYLFVLVAVAAPIGSLVAYRMAVERARVWGGLVKAAFDRYLPALGEHLGLDPEADDTARMAFWHAVSRRLTYRRPITTAEWQRFGKVRKPAPQPEETT
jgi:hypothetical protein